MPKPQQALFWHRDGLIIQEWDQGEFTIHVPGKAGKVTHRIPNYLQNDSLDCFDGAFWATAMRERGDGGRILDLFWSPTGAQWYLSGTLNAPKDGIPCRIMPLDVGLFLVESLKGFHQGNRHSFLAIATMTKDQQLSIKDVLDPDLKRPLFQQDRKGVWEIHPGCAALSSGFGYMIARSEDAVLMANGKLGWIWLVETRKPSPSLKRIRLYPLIDERYLDRPFARGLEMGILGIQPRRNGHFLIAARSEDAVLHGRDFEQEIEPTRHVQDPGTFSRNALLSDGQRRSVQAYPELEWWDLDPVSGALEKVPTPPGAPSKFASPAAIQAFRFRMDLRDRVVIGD